LQADTCVELSLARGFFLGAHTEGKIFCKVIGDAKVNVSECDTEELSVDSEEDL
jgi:hypothetical protein